MCYKDVPNFYLSLMYDYDQGKNLTPTSFFILVKTQQQVLALDKENKQMKQTLTYLQQELIKSGKKNIPKVPDKGSNSNAS